MNRLHDDYKMHDYLEDTRDLLVLEWFDTNSNIDQLICDVHYQSIGIWFHQSHIHPSNCKTCRPFQGYRIEEGEGSIETEVQRREWSTKQ